MKITFQNGLVLQRTAYDWQLLTPYESEGKDGTVNTKYKPTYHSSIEAALRTLIQNHLWDGDHTPQSMLDEIRLTYSQLREDLENFEFVKAVKSDKSARIWSPESNMDSHPDHPATIWQVEVSEGLTRQSYIEWVNRRLKSEAEAA